MLPSLLITFREVIEASLIVATILGILTKLKQTKGIRTVWLATAAAACVSILLLAGGAVFGIKVQELYTGVVEEIIEGTLMIVSAFFITWAVFFLHKYFGRYKTQLLSKIRSTVEQEEQKGLFILTFTAVFREGFEIVLFLSTIFFSSDPTHILTGFGIGAFAALVVSAGLFTATLRLPVFYAFRVTSILLILFAAGLLARGIHEFAEVGIVPEVLSISFGIIPESSTFVGSIIKAIFGLTTTMDALQLISYTMYTALMVWYVFFRKTITAPADHHDE